jgi:hypothetical protein
VAGEFGRSGGNCYNRVMNASLPPPPTDVQNLMVAEAATRTDHIYLVSFQVMTHIEQLDTMGWIDDELTVATGFDAQQAIAKVQAYVNGGEYGLPVSEFRLRGVKLLAEADI